MHGPFDAEQVREALTLLPPKRRLAFALGCSERLYPNYVAFHREQGWGDPQALRSALNAGWDVLKGHHPDPSVLARLRRRVHDAEPETEDFDTILVSSALDAANAAGLVLKVAETGDIESAVEIASLCHDTVDMYAQESESMDSTGAELEQQILSHPLMQEELRRQRDDLASLAQSGWTPDDVRRFEEAWREPEVSNIGKRLVG
jgi:uncharacterized protein YjaG (DUF416 family)